MNELMLKDFVLPIILSSRYGIPLEEAEEIIKEAWKND